MLTLGSILALAAAALHVVIFRLESLAWGGTQAQKVFGEQSPHEVAATRELAFNQGFYNLFLALAVFIGLIVFGAGSAAVGLTLVFVGAGSMLAAALVLALSSRELLASALKQGTLPLLGVLCLIVGVLV